MYPEAGTACRQPCAPPDRASHKAARARTFMQMEWFGLEALEWVVRGVHSDRCECSAVAKGSVASSHSKVSGH